MPIPKEVMDRIAENIKKAESSLAELKDVVTDMKLSGMDTVDQERKVDDLTTKLHSMSMFYELRKAKGG